jgi:uncharacterized protein YecE (DUF72 family)
MIRVGTAGWSYADWDGKVYPRSKPHGFHPLPLLAKTFDCVEINSTFYAQPSAVNSTRWVQLVADQPAFRFLVKLNRDFTHRSQTPEWEEKAREFLSGIEPLRRARRLSAMLVQFPVSFLFGKQEVRRLGTIHGLFQEVPLVLEVRHESWFTRPALDTIRGLGFSLAHIDLPYAWNHPPANHPSVGPLGYLRLHGRNAEAWFRSGSGRNEQYDYLYSPEELGQLTQKARRIEAEHGDAYVVTNNHFAGKAFANGVEMLYELRGQTVPAPREVVDTYPHLAPMTRAHREGQQELF